MRCPGFTSAAVRPMSDDDAEILAATGTAREWHLSPNHPHLFCGCGSETTTCHPERCCTNDAWGQCKNCGMPAPDPDPIPEAELSEPLFEIGGQAS